MLQGETTALRSITSAKHLRVRLRLGLLAFSVCLLSSTAAPASNDSQTHHGDLRSLFRASDYPREAIEKGWTGTVVAELLVGADGNVERCTIVQSSGHDVLDQKTCDVLSTRAKFTPARDVNGNATGDLVRSPPINWGLRR